MKSCIRENRHGKLPLGLVDGEGLMAGEYPSPEILKKKIPALKEVKAERKILEQLN